METKMMKISVPILSELTTKKFAKNIENPPAVVVAELILTTKSFSFCKSSIAGDRHIPITFLKKLIRKRLAEAKRCFA